MLNKTGRRLEVEDDQVLKKKKKTLVLINIIFESKVQNIIYVQAIAGQELHCIEKENILKR